MKEMSGDLWALHTRGAFVVVPTNIGYTKAGDNVMGRGVALQAARRWPNLPRIWGGVCRQFGSKTTTTVLADHGLILFPTKPFNARQPWVSWKQNSSIELIARSTRDLVTAVQDYNFTVALPLVGCGNGNLDEADVLPVLRKYLTRDIFVLVRRPER